MCAAKREIQAGEHRGADIAGRTTLNVIGSRPRIHFDIRRAFAEVVAVVGAPGGETARGHGGAANGKAIDFCARETLDAVMQLASGESFAHAVGEVFERQLVVAWI